MKMEIIGLGEIKNKKFHIQWNSKTVSNQIKSHHKNKNKRMTQDGQPVSKKLPLQVMLKTSMKTMMTSMNLKRHPQLLYNKPNPKYHLLKQSKLNQQKLLRKMKMMDLTISKNHPHHNKSLLKKLKCQSKPNNCSTLINHQTQNCKINRMKMTLMTLKNLPQL